MLLFVCLDLHSVIFRAHLMSVCLATCPGQRQFTFVTSFIMSVTLDLLLISSFLILYLSDIPSIARSIALCAVLSLFAYNLVSSAVSIP